MLSDGEQVAIIVAVSLIVGIPIAFRISYHDHYGCTNPRMARCAGWINRLCDKLCNTGILDTCFDMCCIIRRDQTNQHTNANTNTNTAPLNNIPNSEDPTTVHADTHIVVIAAETPTGSAAETPTESVVESSKDDMLPVAEI